jgi:hypothetical protein
LKAIFFSFDILKINSIKLRKTEGSQRLEEIWMFDVHKYINTAFCKFVPNGEKKKLIKSQGEEGSRGRERKNKILFCGVFRETKLSAALQC